MNHQKSSKSARRASPVNSCYRAVRHLIDFAVRSSADSMILRDMMMLVNQIPLFVLKKMWQLQHSSLILADVSSRSMLVGLCKDLSPFKMRETIPVLDCAHLLDLLYHMIVPEMGEPSDHEVVVKVDDQKEAVQGKKISFPNIGDLGFSTGESGDCTSSTAIGNVLIRSIDTS
ncbi:hypothetical protein L1049_004003 [Liquidambar formosana]|uniref:Uncharacterized protein n=1 Tax=Liquidambar formosana TaxID=63359 RepID=A0AAP0WZW6_LIQFO